MGSASRGTSCARQGYLQPIDALMRIMASSWEDPPGTYGPGPGGPGRSQAKAALIGTSRQQEEDPGAVVPAVLIEDNEGCVSLVWLLIPP
ncbi:unnamed protein product [Lota lota]